MTDQPDPKLCPVCGQTLPTTHDGCRPVVVSQSTADHAKAAKAAIGKTRRHEPTKQGAWE